MSVCYAAASVGALGAAAASIERARPTACGKARKRAVFYNRAARGEDLVDRNVRVLSARAITAASAEESKRVTETMWGRRPGRAAPAPAPLPRSVCSMQITSVKSVSAPPW